MKLFIHIAKTGEIQLLNAKDSGEAWEEIVRRNCLANEVHEYKMYLDALKSFGLLVNQYIRDKAHIMKLSFKVDKGSIEYLRGKGYVIDTTSTLAYTQSLVNALKKRENLMTRISMKKKEIERISLQQTKEQGGEKGLEQILASLSFQIGFPINDDVTLARFNEYNRIVKLKLAEAKRNGRN